MSEITTHVLDLTLGGPAAGIEVRLTERNRHGEWRDRGRAVTDDDGRAGGLLGSSRLGEATYRLRFETAAYFAGRDAPAFYPFVDVVFEVRDPASHYHVPVLLSPWGYSTYRGT